MIKSVEAGFIYSEEKNTFLHIIERAVSILGTQLLLIIFAAGSTIALPIIIYVSI